MANDSTPLLDGKEWTRPERDGARLRLSSTPARGLFRALIGLLGLSSALAGLTLWQLPRSTLTSLRQPAAIECDPFALPGWLEVDLDHAETAVWTPFESSCRPSHLLPEARATLFNASLDDAEVRARLPWMVGRTVLKLGDSVDRCAALAVSTPLSVAVDLSKSSAGSWAARWS